MRQPPEKSEHGCFCASLSKPRPRRIALARASADQASMSARRVWISAMRAALLAESCPSLKGECISAVSTLQQAARETETRLYYDHDYTLTKAGHRKLVNLVLGPVHRGLAGRGQPERHIRM